jgi:UDP-2-acetamido-3-amino-2,3-dideoxy-glucuronate N-acetyltransferase
VSDAAFVHATAVVDPGATIGPGTRIWHFSHVMAGARIGAECTLGQNVFVASHVAIGDRVKIQNNVSIYSGVTLEDEVFCGPSMVFTNVRNPRSAFPKRADEYDRTLVRRAATIGANATIVCGVTIGEWAFIGAGAVVSTDVPAHMMAAGVPARWIGWACRCGMRVHETEGRIECGTCGRTYERDGEGLSLEREVAR